MTIYRTSRARGAFLRLVANRRGTWTSPLPDRSFPVSFFTVTASGQPRVLPNLAAEAKTGAFKLRGGVGGEWLGERPPGLVGAEAFEGWPGCFGFLGAILLPSRKAFNGGGGNMGSVGPAWWRSRGCAKKLVSSPLSWWPIVGRSDRGEGPQGVLQGGALLQGVSPRGATSGGRRAGLTGPQGPEGSLMAGRLHCISFLRMGWRWAETAGRMVTRRRPIVHAAGRRSQIPPGPPCRVHG